MGRKMMRAVAIWGTGWLLVAGAQMHAGPAKAQIFAPPTFGVIEIDASLGAQTQTLPLQAGGQDQASMLSAECFGQINAAAPDLIMRLTEPVTRLSIFATAQTDLMMMVRRPTGTYICNDDADGLNPAVTLLKPAAGDYAIWLGTFGSDLAEAALHVSLGAPDWQAVRPKNAPDLFGLELAPPPAPPQVARPAPSGAPVQPIPRPLALEATPGSTAQQIGAVLIAALDSMTTRLDPTGALGARFVTEAPITAQDDGPRIAVNLPGLELWIGGARLRFGTPRVDITPEPAGHYSWRATLDPAIEVVADGAAQGALVWSDSQLSGVLDPDVGLMTQIDALWSNLFWQPRASSDPFALEARQLRLQSNARPTGDGLYAGIAIAEMADLSLRAPDGALRLGKLEARSEATGFDPRLANAVDTLMTALAEGRPLGSVMTPILQGRWGDGQNSMILEDLVFETAVDEGFALDGLRLATGFDGRGDLGSLRLSGALEGGRISHADWPDALAPAGAALAVQLDNLPVRQLLGLVERMEFADGDALDLLGLQALGMIMAAGPALEIEALGLSGGQTDLTGSGGFRLRDGFMAEGGMDLSIGGLDRLIGLVSDGALGAQAARDVVPALVILRGLGRPDPAGDPDRLAYRLDLGEDMRLRVNGLDLQQLAN